MKSVHTVLTQKKTGGSHVQTEVRIEWEGITQAQLEALATHAILWRLQNRWKNYGHFDSIPKEWDETAKDCCNLDPITATCINMPPKYDWMDKLMEGLSDEQKLAIIRDLTQ